MGYLRGPLLILVICINDLPLIIHYFPKELCSFTQYADDTTAISSHNSLANQEIRVKTTIEGISNRFNKNSVLLNKYITNTLNY